MRSDATAACDRPQPGGRVKAEPGNVALQKTPINKKASLSCEEKHYAKTVTPHVDLW